MTTFDRWVFAATLLLALAACFVNVRSIFVGMPPMRPLRAITATLAALYALGYALVLTNTLDLVSWSRMFRPLGLAAWPLVWIIPPLTSDRVWLGVRRGLEAIREEVKREPVD